MAKYIIKLIKKEKEIKANKLGYRRVKLWANGKNKTFHISKLVAEYFIGKIPPDYVVDHINCITTDDYVSNLQIITKTQNAQRATKFSRGLNLNTNTGKGASDLQLVGYIRYLHTYKNYSPDEIIKKVERKFSRLVTRVYISRVVNNKRNTNVRLSKLFVKRKFSETIYDITVEGDESYISNSNYISHNTPYGVGNWFHRMWVNAPANGFNPIRLRWPMHPERDMEWFEEMARSLGPRRTAQEINGDFLSSGSSVFDLTDIRAIEDRIDDLIWATPPEMNGTLWTYQLPERGIRYSISGDVSTGRSRDYSTYSIMKPNGDEVGFFKGKLPPHKFASLLMKKGKQYNNALLAPESNDIGLSVTEQIQTAGYPNLYYSTKILKEKGKSKPSEELIPGFYTTKKNRPLIISDLEEDIREGNIDIINRFFCEEAYTFIYDEATSRPQALGKGRRKSEVDDILADDGFVDDSIIAEAINNKIRKLRKFKPVLPR